MDIGNRIKNIRKSKGMTQAELATKSGVSRVSIGNYERSSRTPDVYTIIKIANGLDVPSWKLISDTEENGLG